MLSPASIEKRFEKSLQIGNYAEAKFEWQWASDTKVETSAETNPVDYAELVFHSIFYHMRNRNITEAIKAESWISENLSNYRRAERARALERISIPRRIFEELIIAEDSGDENAYRKLHNELRKIEWDNSEIGARAVRLNLRNLRSTLHRYTDKNGSLPDTQEYVAHLESIDPSKYPDLYDEICALKNEILIFLSEQNVANIIEQVDLYFRSGDPEKARHFLTEALEVDYYPDITELQNLLQRAECDGPQYTAAMEDAEQQEHLGNLDEAKLALENAKVVFPESRSCAISMERIAKKLAARKHVQSEYDRALAYYDSLCIRREYYMAHTSAKKILGGLITYERQKLFQKEHYLELLKQSKTRSDTANKRLLISWLTGEALALYLLKRFGLR